MHENENEIRILRIIFIVGIYMKSKAQIEWKTLDLRWRDVLNAELEREESRWASDVRIWEARGDDGAEVVVLSSGGR